MHRTHFPFRLVRAVSSGLALLEVIPDVLKSVVAISNEPRPVNHHESRKAELNDNSVHSTIPLLNQCAFGQLVFRPLRFKLLRGKKYAY